MKLHNRRRWFITLLAILSFACLEVGAQTWSRTWGGSAEDAANSVAVHSLTSTLYAGGFTNSFGAGGLDILLARFDLKGNPVWVRTWGGPHDDSGSAVAVDPGTGDAYVIGQTSASGSAPKRIVLLKFSRSGDLLWSKIWHSAQGAVAYGAATDFAGNLFVAGECDGAALLLKFTPAGELVWSRGWRASVDYAAVAYAIDVGPAEIAVAGVSINTESGDKSILLLKFALDGHVSLARSWGSTGGAAAAHGVKMDLVGNTYVTGETTQYGWCDYPGCEFSALTMKIGSTGQMVWTRGWKLSPRYDTGTSVAIDHQGNILVAGISDQGYPEQGGYLVRYDSYGNRSASAAWQQDPWVGVRSGFTGLAVSSNDEVLLGGYSPHAFGYWWTQGFDVSVDGTFDSLSGILSAPRGHVVPRSGRVGVPSGVLDSGGGNIDLFVQLLPSVP